MNHILQLLHWDNLKQSVIFRRVIPRASPAFAMATHSTSPVEQRLTASAITDAAAKSARLRIEWMFANLAQDDYIGEPVSVLQHSWQGYALARDRDESESAQVAALLHDIGHMLGMEAGFEPDMDGCGTRDHEGIGARFLEGLGCAEECCTLVHNHVNAKRYLVTKHDGYELSAASAVTLEFQGGRMTLEEADAFEQHPLFETILRLRGYDEMAKIEGEGNVSPSVIGKVVEDHVRNNLTAVFAADPTAVARFSNPSRYLLSEEQLRFYDENGYLIVRGHPTVSLQNLDQAAVDLANLPESSDFPWLVHHEEVELDFGSTNGGKQTKIFPARAENFVQYHQR